MSHVDEYLSAMCACEPAIGFRCPACSALSEVDALRVDVDAGLSERDEACAYAVSIETALRNLLAQVNKFCEEQGEADFYTGEAVAALAQSSEPSGTKTPVEKSGIVARSADHGAGGGGAKQPHEIGSDGALPQPAFGTLLRWGTACAACGKPVLPPLTNYDRAAQVAGNAIWHGACFPADGVRYMQGHSQGGSIEETVRRANTPQGPQSTSGHSSFRDEERK